MRLSVLSQQCVVVALSFASIGSLARAEEPTLTSNPAPFIYGGEPSATCNFPATVALSGGWYHEFMCSGTLVHPQIVVYASHCGASINSIMFGESVDTPARTVVPEHCEVYPERDIYDGTDWAYCKLAKPINDIPVTPILMGCEQEVLQEGKTVYLVGFGEDDEGNAGVKRQAVAVQHQVEGGKAWIGGDGKDECFGDSGSSAYVQLTPGSPGMLGDNTWRVYSITSYTPASAGAACGAGTFHSLIPNAVPWIEEASGIDITPCHRADGTWDPGPECTDFPMDPAGQGGEWENSCQAGLVGPAGATCGAAYKAR